MRGGEFIEERVPVFFPPTPPPLGRALPRSQIPAGRLAAPPEMAAFVNEPFYPALATRLALKRLPDRLKARVEEYRRAKVARLTELRAALEQARALAPAERAATLSAFAGRQAAALRAQEETAEALRRDLGSSDLSWNAYRQWHLGDNERRGFSPAEIAQVMRAAAYYQDALLPAQRRLLREISLELLNAGENPEAAAANHPYLFFPPEPARITVPAGLPGDVAAKAAEYETRKSGLKKELYDAVFAHDGRRFAWFRPNPLKALAENQRPRLAELEALAEEIRRGLADQPDAVPVMERTPLTPALQVRLNALLQDIGGAQRRAVERIESILAETRDLPMQASYRFGRKGCGSWSYPAAPRGAAARSHPPPSIKSWPHGSASRRPDPITTSGSRPCWRSGTRSAWKRRKSSAPAKAPSSTRRSARRFASPTRARPRRLTSSTARRCSSPAYPRNNVACSSTVRSSVWNCPCPAANCSRSPARRPGDVPSTAGRN